MDDAIESELNKLAESEKILSDASIEKAKELVSNIVLEDSHIKEEVAETKPAEKPQDVSKEQLNSKPDSDIRQFLLNARLPQKIKLALLGNATCRGLLIRESNKMIQQCVLKNPRIQLTEIETFAKNPNLSEFILRTVASNTSWTKNYNIKLGLVFNPKTPQDVSIKWVKFLNVSDLRKLAKSKNVPTVVSIAARKLISED